jgi:toxin CptA
VTIAFLVSLVLVFVVGVAIQRGNTCTVVAFDDLIFRRSPVRLLTFVYAWFLVAGGLTLLSLTTGYRAHAQAVPVTAWSVVAGLVLGVGAVVNGACTNGTLARIGSGEYVYAMTVLGFTAGCALARDLGPVAAIGASKTPTTLSPEYPVLALLGFGAAVLLNVRRLAAGQHESFRDFLRNAWDPRTATFIIAVLFVLLVQIFGPWGYAELIGDVSRGAVADLGRRLALFAALFTGAVIAGRTCTRAKLVGPLKGKVVRCLIGGFIMGIGFSLGPGSFGGLTLYGQPLLLPYAWVVMGASYVAIVCGVVYLRSKYGTWIKTRRA